MYNENKSAPKTEHCGKPYSSHTNQGYIIIMKYKLIPVEQIPASYLVD